MTILNHFEKIIYKFDEDGLSESFYEAASENLETISGLFNITKTQSALLAVIVENEPISIKELSKILNCKKIQMYQHMDDIDHLKSRKLIKINKRSQYSYKEFSSSSNNDVYVVPKEVVNSIRKGVEYKGNTYENLRPEDFYYCADEILCAAENDDLSYNELVEELNALLEANKHISFAKKYKDYDLREGSIIVFFVFACALICYEDEPIKLNRLRDIVGGPEARSVEKRFKSGDHKLVYKKLIEPSNVNGIADTEYYQLTQKAKKELLDDVDKKIIKKNKSNNLILSKDINRKKLFYSQKMKKRIDELTRLLKEKNFVNIQARLKKSKMRTGFACLFSGSPGTGKTETVYQIAKKTGRDIYLVDISETKSMWFGESEKRIKALFDRYRGMVNSAKQDGTLAPILLFNEADAVLGKRQELAGARSGVGQTENAIQNIILQEMENLDGILIATTNMTVNLDKAFERRFLYKMEFEKPDIESKKMMWQSFMPAISEDDAISLAKKFDFSGGQIENITRKCTVSFILNGKTPKYTELEVLCREEIMEKAVAKIGFGA